MASSARVLLLAWLVAMASAARTLKLDAGIGYIEIGPDATCANAPAPVYGSPRICIGPTSHLMLGSMQIAQKPDDTIVFSVAGTTVVAVNAYGAISVGGTLVFGDPGSVTVVPQGTNGVIDGIWTVDSQLDIINAAIQSVVLVGTTAGGMRIKSAASNASVVILDTGQVVVDNNINRNIVLGGIRAGATVITQGSVFAPGRSDLPVVMTVPVPVDGQTRLTLSTFSSPSVCGNALARQTIDTIIDTAVCMTITSGMRAILAADNQPVTLGQTGIVFAQCPDPTTNTAGRVWINATVYSDVGCTTGQTSVTVSLGYCIGGNAMFRCVRAT
jgi:hypothetical protein